jgi:DNA-binding FadR family transcriptional regulator
VLDLLDAPSCSSSSISGGCPPGRPQLTVDGRWDGVVEQRDRIVIAVTDRDGDAASDAAVAHLDYGRALWLATKRGRVD